MKQFILYLFFLFVSANLYGQTSKWTFDPSVSLNAYIELGLTSGTYYNLNNRFSLTGYSAIGIMVDDFAARTNGLSNIESSNQLHLTQKVGMTWWFIDRVNKKNKTKRKGIGFVIGPDFRRYSGKYVSPNDTIIKDEGSNTAIGYGLMYVAHNRKEGKNKGWSFKFYIPLAPYQGPDNIQSFTANFGINFDL